MAWDPRETLQEPPAAKDKGGASIPIPKKKSQQHTPSQFAVIEMIPASNW